MRIRRRLRRASRLGYEYSTHALNLVLVWTMLFLGCMPLDSSPAPHSGVKEYQREAFAKVPGGVVNMNGGNLLIRWKAFVLPTGLQTPEIPEAFYNSASGEWLFGPFQMTYLDGIFTDFSGAVYDTTSVTDGEAIPGSSWIKVNSSTIMTKGQYVHEFNPDGALARRLWLGQICPWIEYIPGFNGAGAATLDVKQHDCGGNLELRVYNRILYTVTFADPDRKYPVSIKDPVSGHEALLTWEGGQLVAARDAQAVENGWPGFQYEYSGSNLTAMTNSEGERIEYAYYAPIPGGMDRLQYVTRIGEGNPQYSLVYYARNLQGTFATVLTDPRGDKRRYRFDDLGRIQEREYDGVQSDGAGVEEVYTYVGDNLHPATRRAINGTVTKFTYLGDEVATTELPSGNVVTSTYAEASNKLFPLARAFARVEDSLGLVGENTYSATGIILSHRNGEGEESQYEWGEGGAFTRLHLVTEPSGVQRTLGKYNSLGQPTEIIQGELASTVTYDAAGDQTQGLPGSPEWGGVRTRVFDAGGNSTQMTVVPMDPDGNLGTEDYVSITRRSDGREIYIARPNGADHEFIYNALGQATERRERVDGVWESTFIEYDLLGNANAVQFPNGMRVEYDYDPLGRLLERRAYQGGALWGQLTNTYQNGALTSTYDSIRGATKYYSYDAAGRLHQTQFYHGEALTLGYDLRDRVISEEWSMPGEATPFQVTEYAYDGADRVTEIRDNGELVVSNTYQDGQLTEICTGNGLCRGFTYDPVYGLRNGSTTRKGSQIIESSSTSYQLTGEPPIWSIESSTSVDSPSLSEAVTEEYYFGPAITTGSPELEAGKRIYRSVLNGVAKGYAYDGLSNRLDADSDWFDYNSEGNRLVAAEVDGQGVDYTYDAAGFATSRNGIPITWTPTQRLATYGSLTLDWDMEDQLLHLSDGTTNQDRSWFGGRIQVDGAGNPLALDLLEVAIDLQTGDRFYRHADFRGNVSFVSDDSGDIVALYGYQPYGVGVTYGDSSDKVRFVGQLEIAPGVYWMGDRIYDSVVGRFLSPDPVFHLLNQYAYTLGNPVWFSDPDGRDWEFFKGLLAAIGLAAALAAISVVTAPFDLAFAIGLAIVAGISFGFALQDIWNAGGGAANTTGSPTQIKCLEMHIEEDSGAAGGGGETGGNPGTVPAGNPQGNGGGNAGVSFGPKGPGGIGGGGAGVPGVGGSFGSIGCGMGGEVILPTMLLWWFYRRRRKQ